MACIIRPLGLGAICVSLFALACGGSDDKVAADPPEEGGEAGAAAVPSYPPAIGPEDCVARVTNLELSQPERAAVWGGLVLLEFKVEGDKARSFEVQMYDPSIGAWVTNYIGTSLSGQREDGSYFLAVSPVVNDQTKDEELKLRVRPSQSGCPEAEWTETDTFSQGDPLVGTSWSGDIPSALFNSELRIERTPLDELAPSLPALPLVIDAGVNVVFGKKKAFTQTVTLDLHTEADAPLDACQVVLTYTGSYELQLRSQYNMSLVLSQQTLTAFDQSTCELPSIEELAFAAEGFSSSIQGYTQGLGIDYVPTVYAEPGMPSWDGNFAQVFQQLTQLLGYVTPTEQGTPSGYIYPLELSLSQDE